MNRCKIRFKSKVLSLPVGLTVLLPQPPRGVQPEQFYSPETRLKVLWLLHPAFGDDEDWLIGSTLETCVPQDLMIVMLSGLNSDYANHPEFGNGYDFPRFFFEELMPFIHHWFPASSLRADNCIAGASMGGSGALMLGLMHPERFAGIGAISYAPRAADYLWPYRAASGAEFRALAEKEPTLFPTRFGDPAGGITPKEINMIAKYPTVQAYLDSPECTERRLLEFERQVEKLPGIYFSCGEKDNCCPQLRRFEQKAGETLHKKMTFDYVPDQNHDFVFWEIAIRNTFKHFAL